MLQLIEQIVTAPDERRSAETALAALKTLVRGDYYSAACFDVERGTFEVFRSDQGWMDTRHTGVRSLVQQNNQNPLALHYTTHRQSTVLFRSQMVGDSLWKRTAFYNEIHRPLGIEDMGAIFLNTSQGRVVGLTCGRSRNFTEQEMCPMRSFQRILSALPQFRSSDAQLGPLTSALTPLSPREREILHWVREGKRDSEIAIILGISPRTVHHHLENIYRKLSVETRTAAAALR